MNVTAKDIAFKSIILCRLALANGHGIFIISLFGSVLGRPIAAKHSALLQ